MRALGYKEPKPQGTTYVKVGTRSVPATEQNIRRAVEVKNADDYVNENFDSSAQANMYTLGAMQLMSPTSIYAYARQLADNDYSMRDVAMNYMTGRNNGVFEGTSDDIKQWAANNSKTASMINYAVDIASGQALRAAPKVVRAGKAMGSNLMENITANSPRMRVQPYVYETAPGNSTITHVSMRRAATQPGAISVGEMTPNGRLISAETGRPGGSPVSVDYVLDGSMPFYVDPIATFNSTPMGYNTYITPVNTHMPNINVPSMQFNQNNPATWQLDGVPHNLFTMPYYPSSYKGELPDATQF